MPYTYTIEARIVNVTWHGVISRGDLESFGVDMPRVGKELGFAPDVLHTFEGVAAHSFQPIAAYVYSLLQKRVEIPNPIRAAIVANSPAGKSMANVFKMLNRAHNLEMEIFANEAAARLWLSRG